MKTLGYIFLCALILSSCNDDTDDAINITLQDYTNGASFETGAVIACAASDALSAEVLTFYYPEPASTNPRFYQTASINVDETDFSNYTQIVLDSSPVFNGTLRRFSQSATSDSWIIVTFELGGEIKISNPIRTKITSKPTLWSDIVSVDQTQSQMPTFSWQDNVAGDNAIYFQVVSDNQDNLLSGTYTNQNQFQYYKLDNVVLNITLNTPPVLQTGLSYNFTLMDVSLDNWVNVVTLNKSFIAE